MHGVLAVVFLVDPLEHFISLAPARDELIFRLRPSRQVFCGLWLSAAARSLADELQGRHGISDSDEGHDFDCFQCVQVGRVSGWHARVEVEEACNARTG